MMRNKLIKTWRKLLKSQRLDHLLETKHTNFVVNQRSEFYSLAKVYNPLVLFML